jgi:hypothetical protein
MEAGGRQALDEFARPFFAHPRPIVRSVRSVEANRTKPAELGPAALEGNTAFFVGVVYSRGRP